MPNLNEAIDRLFSTTKYNSLSWLSLATLALEGRDKDAEFVDKLEMYMPAIDEDGSALVKDELLPTAIELAGLDTPARFADTPSPKVRLLPSSFLARFFGMGPGTAAVFDQATNELWLNAGLPPVFTKDERTSVILHELVHWQYAVLDGRTGQDLPPMTKDLLDKILEEERTAFTVQFRYLSPRGGNMRKFFGKTHPDMDGLEQHLQKDYVPHLSALIGLDNVR